MNTSLNRVNNQKIIFESLQFGWKGYYISYSSMDPRLYIYELRRPRVSNPTFNSSLINNSCFSIYKGGPLDHDMKSSQTSANILQPQIKQYKEQAKSRASSLSNYGGSSLLRIQDKDVYQKQNQRYNIISMEPVKHQQTIKKYPKLTLQDKDAYYFRKMVDGQLQKRQNEQIKQLKKEKQGHIAGISTYQLDKDKVQLNLWQSYGNAPQKHKQFQLKMLNHADQFRSLM